MSEMQRQVLECEIKAKTDDSRVLSFVGTTGGRDRMGDEISTAGWDLKAYKKNPVFLWAHSYQNLPIGRTLKIDKEDDKLIFDVEFATADLNPMAEQVFQLYKQGFLRGTSVGFRSLDSEWLDLDSDEETEKRKKTPDVLPGKRFRKTELLELSAVPVPANPDALMTARRKGMEVPQEVNDRLAQWCLERAMEAESNEPPAPQTEIADEEVTHKSVMEYMFAHAEELRNALGIPSEPDGSQTPTETQNTPEETPEPAAAGKDAEDDGARTVDAAEQSDSEGEQVFVEIGY